ncbi:MAG: tRNA (adenosine(37)-N6)-threonylcarbamoyltransferase complex ATPase subunit type 1 TsaE [Candidatus Levybacteria bacterium RBG_13_35_9]|nr:MAG: tRNA (adenosine(37)-N6)-threonylcarbamoyltransferase complex ATPase subunit type 1 TsaE [Candidatus Levybacteria bacterium RBG_13_35_9]
MKNNIILTKNPAETKKFAENFSKSLKEGDILCLYGNLGSGKTTFVQGLAKGLGIKKRIFSPTFIIVRSYKIDDRNFYHIDLYRTQAKQDLLGVGIDEILKDNKNIVCVEWAEKLFDLIPRKRMDIKFKYLRNDEREIGIKTYD